MTVSSLTVSWQQPVFVDFDSAITKDTVIGMIVDLYRIGYWVACLSSDCSESSARLWKDLGASADRPCFPHPVGGDRIVVIPDAMHCVRAVRDWLLDGGFEIEGSAVNSSPLDFLLDSDVCSKLRPFHLQPNEGEKRRTDVAVQLVSNEIGTALTRVKPGDAEVATSTGNFLKVMSHWYSLMNVDTSDLTVPFRSPYGYKRREQDKLLDHVKAIISLMKIGNSYLMESFQIGIIMSCNGLPLLLDEMKKRLSMEHIATQRLNHTTLDGLFSVLSADFSQVPTPVAALSRLQSILFGELPDPKKQSVFTLVMRQARIKPRPSKPRGRLPEAIASPLLDDVFSTLHQYIINNKLTRQCLYAIASAVNRALGGKYPQLRKFPEPSEREPDGHDPTAYFLGNLVKMEKLFVAFTSGLIAAECKNISARLVRTMKGLSNSLPLEVIRIFVRLRIDIYARSLVPKLAQLARKRMMHSRLLMALREKRE